MRAWILALAAPCAAYVASPLRRSPVFCGTSRVVVGSSSAEIDNFIDSTFAKEDTKEAESLVDFTSTESGLKFKDVVVGSGPSPTPGDELEVQYAGWYYEPGSSQGVKFDDSRERSADKGLVFEYGIAPIIEGWKEGLVTMKPGGKRTLIVPPPLGYGDKEVRAAGRPPIPANSELRFELELVAVDNSIIRKFRRGVGDFLRPPGNQYVTAEEKAQVEAGTMEKPLLERLFNDVTNKEK